MHFTVEQALSVYPLSEGKLIAGAGGSNRLVKAINVMDAPDIADWIKEGEMLFTTAYLYKDRPEDALELLHKLERRKAAGLGIKLGRFWKSVPEVIVKEADRLGFPLIELPYAFTFSDQMNGLFQAEMKRATTQLQDVMEKQVKLMRFALQAEPGSSLFDSVAEVTGVRVAVVGAGGRLIYPSNDPEEERLLQGWPWAPHKSKFKLGSGQALRVPVMKREGCAAFVVFCHPHPVLSPLEEGLYVQAAELIAFHLNKYEEDFFGKSVWKDFGMLLRRYLKEGMELAKLNEYAERWGVELLNKPYRCVLSDWPAELEGSKARQERLVRLKEELPALARLTEADGLHLILEEGLLSILPDDPLDGEGHVEELIRSALTGPKLRRLGYRAAISSRKRDAGSLKEALKECTDALRLSAEWGISDKVVSYGQLDLALVFEGVPRERMEMYCSRWLGGLLEEKPDYAQEMLRTLETFLECDGQLNETAKRLFIHRNTVAYRIEKLGELLQVDFKKVGDLMRLKLAFLFRRQLIGGSEGAERAV